jgi:hypothetical protein
VKQVPRDLQIAGGTKQAACPLPTGPMSGEAIETDVIAIKKP